MEHAIIIIIIKKVHFLFYSKKNALLHASLNTFPATNKIYLSPEMSVHVANNAEDYKNIINISLYPMVRASRNMYQ